MSANSVHEVTVRVPATAANLGPAFDVLGLALDVWLEVTIQRAPAGVETAVTMTGEGAQHLTSNSADNLIVVSFNQGLKLCGVEPYPVIVTAANEIPFGAGCGSSSAATIAGIVAAFAMCGKKFSGEKEELLQIAAKIEGHPDNAAPAIYGGVQLVINSSGTWSTHRINTPSTLWCVIFTPHKLMKTHTTATRKLIPDEVPMRDAIHNMARTALLVHSLATCDFSALKLSADDRFHQQQRAPIFPHMNAAIEAAFASGALYACLSGAGPAVLALVPGRVGDLLLQEEEELRCNAVGKAMVEAAAREGVEGRFFATAPSAHGVHVKRS
jgi:homoserine kinase